MQTIKHLISVLNNKYKLYTAAQIGLDTKTSKILSDYFDYTYLYGHDDGWSETCLRSVEWTNSYLYKSLANLQEYLNYFELGFDFVYIHNRDSADFQREMYQHFMYGKTPFILTHPDVYSSRGANYSVINFLTEEGEYKLYYLDVARNAVNEINIERIGS